MNDSSVDKFLLAHCEKIDDNGFSKRVLQNLPVREAKIRRMTLIWNVIFVIALVAFCWYTDVLGKLMVDIEVYATNMPLNLLNLQWWYSIAVVMMTMFGLVALGFKKIISD